MLHSNLNATAKGDNKTDNPPKLLPVRLDIPTTVESQIRQFFYCRRGLMTIGGN
jgi:hypothetical protein